VLPAVNPVVDDYLTPQQSLPFSIVAIGASAGGLEAFTTLLNALPTDTGMASSSSNIFRRRTPACCRRS
jgi:chemotaxis response regulator CheB